VDHERIFGVVIEGRTEMKCPNCLTEEEMDDMGYTALNPEIDNPHLQISVPTCGQCGYQYKDDMDHWCIPPYYFDSTMRVLGGMILMVQSSGEKAK